MKDHTIWNIFNFKTDFSEDVFDTDDCMNFVYYKFIYNLHITDFFSILSFCILKMIAKLIRPKITMKMKRLIVMKAQTWIRITYSQSEWSVIIVTPIINYFINWLIERYKYIFIHFFKDLCKSTIKTTTVLNMSSAEKFLKLI